MKVLLVEDDQALANLLSAAFATDRHTVDVATDGQLGLSLALEWNYDVILLDILIPRLDGVSLCRQLRSQRCQTPILMLTAKDSNQDIITGLDAGADDYVTKPCEPAQLLARVRALSRRGSQACDMMLTWGKLTLDPAAIRVTYDRQEINLAPKEYRLLELFLRNPQRSFSRNAIIDHLWTLDETPVGGTVTNLIKDLRQRLKAGGVTEELIQTLHKVGYRLMTAPTEPQENGQIQESQQRENQPDWEPDQNTPVSVKQAMEQFTASLHQRLQVLQLAESALQTDSLTINQHECARAEAHRLAGNLGSFGYAKGSDVARAIELLLTENASLGAAQAAQFSNLLTALKQALAQPASQIAKVQTAPNGMVLMIDCDSGFSQRLQQEAEHWGFTIEVMGDRSTVWHRLAKVTPSVLLLALGNDSVRNDRLALLQELRAEFPAIPTLILAEQDNLDDRIAVAELGIERFLSSPVTSTQVFEIMTQVLSKAQVSTATVMILNDDPLTLKAISGLLLSRGIQVICLLHPKQFWAVLKSTNPDVLLLNLEMPLYKGTELCKIVRQDAQFKDLPILVMTANTNTESTKRAFAAGADDVIDIPIEDEVLITRIINRIERFNKPHLPEIPMPKLITSSSDK